MSGYGAHSSHPHTHVRGYDRPLPIEQLWLQSWVDCLCNSGVEMRDWPMTLISYMLIMNAGLGITVPCAFRNGLLPFPDDN